MLTVFSARCFWNVARSAFAHAAHNAFYISGSTFAASSWARMPGVMTSAEARISRTTIRDRVRKFMGKLLSSFDGRVSGSPEFNVKASEAVRQA
jgi:hypothetical protein